MCVTQFRDYCKAYSFKKPSELKKNEEVMEERGSFWRGRSLSYVKDNAKIKKLAGLGNVYALEGKNA